MTDYLWPSGSDSSPLLRFSHDLNFGFVDKAVESSRTLNPEIVFNSKDSTMLRALRSGLRHCTSFTFSVAFISPRAIALLKQELAEFQGTGRIITSDYLGFNSPEAFAELLNLSAGRRNTSGSIQVRIHRRSDFHPKGYVFTRAEDVTAIMGSSNLTENALVSNREWNLRVSASRQSDLARQLDDLMSSELAESDELSQSWIDTYRLSYRRQVLVPPVRGDRAATSFEPPKDAPSKQTEDARPTVTPNLMQVEALNAIEKSRKDGNSKALVISATGTGKTILAALHARLVNPKRMLFIVHREQILDKAITEFKKVLNLPSDQFGKLVGKEKDVQARFVFATVQTLARPDVYSTLDTELFDYILIDEVHRAGAPSYRQLMSYFKPDFWLGITATPDRSDGINIYEMFDFNVPYEIRLNKALESGMLCPFHYYGVADVVTEDGEIVDSLSELRALTSTTRVRHIVDTLEYYGQSGIQPRGLIFCSTKSEAQRLSNELNTQRLHGKPLRTRALTGDDPVEARNMVIKELECGALDYVLTVDIFNEGVDIPSVNQVIMLRQTESAIVFIQQLGRGLRKHPGKDYVVVIDFIGNYANNYLIPTALFGDESLDKESLRQHLIAAEESGVLAGMSSIRFDRISQARVLSAIATSKLDSMVNLKSAFRALENRLGRTPQLIDFHLAQSVDPVVMGTRVGNYPALACKFSDVEVPLTGPEDSFLTYLSNEILPAKRPHEALVLRWLINNGPAEPSRILKALATEGKQLTEGDIESVIRILTLEFSTQVEKAKYKLPILERSAAEIRLSPSFAQIHATSPAFRRAVEDVVATALELSADRYGAGDPFVVGRQYSRKDACRLLNWKGNSTSTIYGYKVDAATKTCPIFVTLHKAEDVSSTTAYGDTLVDRSTLHWFTKSRRTLASGEVIPIVSNAVELHVFVKKDDTDGTDFFYLGRAQAKDAFNSTMGGSEKVPVVEMSLVFESPVPSATYDYFRPSITHV